MKAAQLYRRDNMFTLLVSPVLIMVLRYLHVVLDGVCLFLEYESIYLNTTIRLWLILFSMYNLIL